MNEILPIYWTCVGTLLVNIPFGYLRARYKKLTFMWFLYIHLPVPLVIYIRFLNGIDLTWTLAPFLFGSYFLGQFIGRKWRLERGANKLSVKEKRATS